MSTPQLDLSRHLETSPVQSLVNTMASLHRECVGFDTAIAQLDGAPLPGEGAARTENVLVATRKRFLASVTAGDDLHQWLSAEVGPEVANFVLAQAHAKSVFDCSERFTFLVSSEGVEGFENTSHSQSVEERLQRLVELSHDFTASLKQGSDAAETAGRRLAEATERTAISLVGDLHNALGEEGRRLELGLVQMIMAHMYFDSTEEAVDRAQKVIANS